MPMYVQPPSANAGSNGAFMEEVTEEIMNGFFCHYEPPTSEAAQRKAAQQVISGEYSSSSSSSTAASTKGGRSRGRSPSRRRSTSSVKNSQSGASQGSKDARDEAEDDPPPPERLRSRSKSILKESRLTRNSSAVNLTRSVTWRDQPNQERTEPEQTAVDPEPQMAACDSPSCDFLQSSTAEDGDKNDVDPIEEFRNKKSPKHQKSAPSNRKVLYDDEGNPINDDDVEEEDDIIISGPDLVLDDVDIQSPRNNSKDAAASPDIDKHAEHRAEPPTPAMPSASASSSFFGSLYDLANSCGLAVGGPTVFPETPIAVSVPISKKSKHTKNNANTNDAEDDADQINASKPTPNRRTKNSKRANRADHNQNDKDASVRTQKTNNRTTANKRPQTPYKPGESWDDDASGPDAQQHNVPTRRPRSRSSERIRNLSRVYEGNAAHAKFSHTARPRHNRDQEHSDDDMENRSHNHQTSSPQDRKLETSRRRSESSSNATKLMSNSGNNMVAGGVRNMTINTQTPRGGTAEIDSHSIASPKQAYEKAVSPKAPPAPTPQKSPFAKVPRKWRLGSKGAWKHADDISLTSLQNMNKSKKSKNGKSKTSKSFGGSRGTPNSLSAKAVYHQQQQQQKKKQRKEQQQQKQQARKEPPQTHKVPTAPRRVERVPRPQPQQLHQKASQTARKAPPRGAVGPPVAGLNEVISTRASLRKIERVSPSMARAEELEEAAKATADATSNIQAASSKKQSYDDIIEQRMTNSTNSNSTPDHDADTNANSRPARYNRDPTPRRTFANAVYKSDDANRNDSMQRDSMPPTPRRPVSSHREHSDEDRHNQQQDHSASSRTKQQGQQQRQQPRSIYDRHFQTGTGSSNGNSGSGDSNVNDPTSFQFSRGLKSGNNASNNPSPAVHIAPMDDVHRLRNSDTDNTDENLTSGVDRYQGNHGDDTSGSEGREDNHHIASAGINGATRSAKKTPSSPVSMITTNTDSEIREEVSSVGMESNTLRPLMHSANPFNVSTIPAPIHEDGADDTTKEQQQHQRMSALPSSNGDNSGLVSHFDVVQKTGSSFDSQTSSQKSAKKKGFFSRLRGSGGKKNKIKATDLAAAAAAATAAE